MADDTVVSHDQALRLVDAQIGAEVYPRAPKPPRLDPDVGFYEHGGDSLHLAPGIRHRTFVHFFAWLYRRCPLY